MGAFFYGLNFGTFVIMKRIISIQNPTIKNILKLQEKSRERKKQGVFIIEGRREIDIAIKSSYKLLSVLFLPKKNLAEYINTFQDIEMIELSKEVYQKIAYRETTEGIIAVAAAKKNSLETIIFKKENPLILVLESIEKPGNIGAMLRTAEAANIDAVILADPKTDLYNPNIIRASLGGIFSNQIAIASSEQVIAFLEQYKIKIYVATLQNSNSYTKENYTISSAIVVGSEASGVNEIWREKATKNIHIPMSGAIDSMNVSVAAAILIYEAQRQRNFNHL